jgi:hypothetical protein
MTTASGLNWRIVRPRCSRGAHLGPERLAQAVGWSKAHVDASAASCIRTEGPYTIKDDSRFIIKYGGPLRNVIH